MPNSWHAAVGRNSEAPQEFVRSNKNPTEVTPRIPGKAPAVLVTPRSAPASQRYSLQHVVKLDTNPFSLNPLLNVFSFCPLSASSSFPISIEKGGGGKQAHDPSERKLHSLFVLMAARPQCTCRPRRPKVCMAQQPLIQKCTILHPRKWGRGPRLDEVKNAP